MTDQARRTIERWAVIGVVVITITYVAVVAWLVQAVLKATP